MRKATKNSSVSTKIVLTDGVKSYLRLILFMNSSILSELKFAWGELGVFSVQFCGFKVFMQRCLFVIY